MKTLLPILVSCLLFIFASCNNTHRETTETEFADTSLVQKASALDTTIQRIGIKMEESGGVFTIPCYVNGVKMNFIFDTGASNVCISLTEALFLSKNGYLNDDDIIGTGYTQVADGSIVENMEINLHSIEIGGVMVTDVRAIVTKSINAPLLLGQSAIQKLGRIEMEGDSIFIFKRGINLPKATENKKVITSEPLSEFTWWDRIKLLWGDDTKNEQYLFKAMELANNDMPELAKEYIKKSAGFCNGNSNLWKTYAVSGYIYYSMGWYSDAAQSYELYMKFNPEKKSFFLDTGDALTYLGGMWKLAYSYVLIKDYYRAIPLAQSVLENNPDYVPCFPPIILAYINSSDHRYDKAEIWANKLLSIPNGKSEGYYYLGLIRKKQGLTNDAIRYFEKCIEINPNRGGAYQHLSELYKNLNPSYSKTLERKAASLGNPYTDEWLKDNAYN